ncbi:MAG: extracellular solute-binding protein [Lachnospiraceae bacterium]|nr:extracellular solute-binding protein [Lachnospiraceae bacterium]
MKKKLLALLLAGMMITTMLAGCVSDDDVPETPAVTETAPVAEPPEVAEEIADEDFDEMELVDGNWRFKETRQITALIYERNNDIRTPAHDNYYTDFIKSELLRIHNIELTEYVPVGRWEESDTIPLWLASGDAPDVCVTYNHAAIQEYAAMGAVHDLTDLVHEHRSRLTHMWDLFTEHNIYGARNPETGAIYYLETTLANSARINTFVREDWLAALGLAEPKTTQEFEDMLIAFRDNADLLLGNNAARMVPFGLASDVGWQTNNLLVSFTPDGITERERYVLGGDERQTMWPGTKEAVRVLNRWFNESLIYPEFALITGSDDTLTNLVNAGFVGSFMSNWDIPYRGENSNQVLVKQEVGPEAAFIAVDPFQNDAGNTFKVRGGAFDRKIFFPATNTEPLASIFFIDFMSRPEIIQHLQLGIEGINHDIVDGVPIFKAAVGSLKDDEGEDVLDDDGKRIPADETNLPYIINSPNNIDMTITINGFYRGGGLTALALPNSFPGTDARYIEKALEYANKNSVPNMELNLGEIFSQSGMAEVIQDKRDSLFANAIRANPADFDAVYDQYWQEYLDSGMQAIIDERAERWAQYFGTADFRPTD